MSKDTVISYSKDTVCVVPHSYSPSLNMVRSRIGAFWRGLTGLSAHLQGGKSQYVGYVQWLHCLLVVLSTTLGLSPYTNVTLASSHLS
jgi:hypothetical protein